MSKPKFDAELELRRIEAIEARHEREQIADEQLAARDRLDEFAPLPDWHPWKAEQPIAPAVNPSVAERRQAA